MPISFSRRPLLGLVISTSHKKWAIGSLANILRAEINNSGLISMPQSRRDARVLKGFVYLPRYKNYLFMHHALAVEAWHKGWISKEAIFGVRFTHESIDISNETEMFNAAKFITVERMESKNELIRIGLDSNKIFFLPHPIDVAKFQCSTPSFERDIVFVSSYAGRKNPELILETISSNPSLTFTIFGRNWENWENYKTLLSLGNLNYVPFNYEIYPQILAKHKVFCSLSTIEGGPVPLLESLASGLKVVVTDTGYVRDVLQTISDYNILPIRPNVTEVSNALVSALKDSTISKASYDLFSVENYVSRIRDLFEL